MSSNQIRRRSRRRQSGTATVEFALVFPLVLMFFLGLTIFTQSFLLRDSAEHAAYEGARQGTNLQATSEDIISSVETFLSVMRINVSDVTVSPTEITTATEEIEVTVDIPFADNSWIGAAFIPEDWMISSTIKLRRFFND